MTGTSIAVFRCDITPKEPVPLAGYRRRSGSWSRIETPLEANGVIYETEEGRVALVAIDTLFAGYALSAAITEAWEGPESMPEIVWLASHTHGAPALDPTKPRLGAMDRVYFDRVAAEMAQAMSAAAPHFVARRRSGQAAVAGATWRRKRAWQASLRPPFLRPLMAMLPAHKVEIPRNLDLHILEESEGTPAAVLWSWPCHPLSTADLYAVSADFPGLLRDQLRVTLNRPDLPVLYAPGFCGDLRPAITSDGFSFNSALRYPTGLGMTEIFRRPDAATQGALVANLWTGMQTACAAAPVAAGARAGLRRSSMPAPELRHEGGAVAKVSLSRCDIAGLTVLAVGAEVSARHLAPLAALLPGPAILTGCAGQTIGYLPTDAQLREGGYEVTGFREGFSLVGKWASGIDARLSAAVKELML